MTALLTARLAAWREVHARWPLFLIAPLLLLLTMPLRQEVRDAVGLFVVLVLLPPLTVYLAARPGARSDPFWRGLGGPKWAALAGAAGVHVAVLGTTALAALPTLDPHDAGLVMALGGLGFLVLYSTTAAARSVSSGGVVIGGLIIGGSLLFLGSWLSLLVWKWPPVLALLVRTGMLITGCVGFALYGETVAGAWGGAVRRSRLGIGWALAAGVLFGPLALDAADIGGAWRSGLALNAIGPNGGSAIYGPRYSSTWWEAPGRMVRWTEDGPELFGPPGGQDAEIGPAGAIAVTVFNSELEDHDVRTWLRTASGLELECPGMLPAWPPSWRSDGEAIVLQRHHPWAEPIPAGVPSRAVLDVDGCTPLAPDVAEVGWDRGRRVELTKNRVLRVEDGPRIDLTEAIEGSELGRPSLHHVGDRIVLSLFGVRGATAAHPEARGRPGFLAVLEGDQIRVLEHGPGVTSTRVFDDEVCTRVADKFRCRRPDRDWGLSRTLPRGFDPAPVGAIAWDGVRLTHHLDGRTWSVASPRERGPGSYRFRTRLVRDRLRVFHDDRVEEIDTHGDVTVLDAIP
jgi:hypothetical protein